MPLNLRPVSLKKDCDLIRSDEHQQNQVGTGIPGSVPRALAVQLT